MNAMFKTPAPVRHAIEDDPRWSAWAERDPEADGAFVVCVRTTGIYCRPTCPARRPKSENVVFLAGPAEAERAGFRACKRCRPDGAGVREAHAALVAEACRTLESAEEPPSLGGLAKAAGLSPFHFHRLFKAATGVTPKAYASGRRAQRVRTELVKPGASVTQAFYDAGFNSNGRFYEASDGMLGMTPSQFRSGGAEADIRFAIGQSSLGAVLVAASARGVCAIFLHDDPEALVRHLQDRFPNANLIGGDAAFEKMVAAVVGLVETPSRGLDLPLDIRGTVFQQRVWRALRDIPIGETASYAEIAGRIGAPTSARAVAAACAANRIAVAIPCHRVVRTDGSLSGYRWGVERKRALLKREGAG